MRMTELPATERPRERLLRAGAAALSDAELLAIFLRTGVRGASATLLAQRLLARFGGLAALAGTAPQDLAAESGVGAAKACMLVAAVELAVVVEPESAISDHTPRRSC